MPETIYPTNYENTQIFPTNWDEEGAIPIIATDNLYNSSGTYDGSEIALSHIDRTYDGGGL